MNQIYGIAVVLAFAVIGVTMACTGEDATPTPGQVPPGTPIPGVIAVELRVGESYSISLESNPTTGYSWQARIDDVYVELTEQIFISESDLVGAGGLEKLSFTALTPGTTEIELTYARPWENDPINRQRILFTIGVDPSAAERMTAEEALELARNDPASADIGPPRGQPFYNDWTGTWWVDLDAEVEGCAPASVIHVLTGKVEVNMRCTGALPPTE